MAVGARVEEALGSPDGPDFRSTPDCRGLGPSQGGNALSVRTGLTEDVSSPLSYLLRSRGPSRQTCAYWRPSLAQPAEHFPQGARGPSFPPSMRQTRKLVTHRQVTVEGWRTAPAVAAPGGLNPQCLHLALVSPPVLPIAWCAMGPLERGPGALGFGCPHEVQTLVFSTSAVELVAICQGHVADIHALGGQLD